MLRTGIVCPVGALDRYGYQHNFVPVLQSLCAFADQVYLCSTTANRTHVDDLLGRFPNLQYVWDEQVSFDKDGNGNEVFNIAKVEGAVNLGLERCRQDGMDCALNIHINQYVQERACEHLEALCRRMLDRDRPFEWLYKKYQVGDKMFHTDTRLPWIVNLRLADDYMFRADSLHRRDGSKVYRIEHAGFRFMDYLAIVDCAMELTIRELSAKMAFVRGYEEISGRAWGGFDPEVYLPYYAAKFSNKVLSSEKLDPTGKVIASSSRGDFVGWEILRRYERPSVWRRLVRFLLGQYLARLR